MKKETPAAEINNEAGENKALATTMRRREMLRLGAIGVGVGLPMVMTLVPKIARAEGSWRCVPGQQAGAQGSWSCNGEQGGRPGWDKDRGLHTRDAYDRPDERKQAFVFPGSHEWRARKEAEEEKKRKMRGEFGRFGSNEDWR